MTTGPHSRLRNPAVVFLAVLLPGAALAQHTPPAEVRQALQEQTEALAERVAALREPASTETLARQQAWADVAVFAKAAEWMLRHDEFYRVEYTDQLRQALQLGEQRAAALERGESPWQQQPGSRIHACVSTVDRSVQPFAVTLPRDWEPDTADRYPLHLVLHGRANQMNEVNFIARWEGKPAPEDQTWIQLDVYGRGNNAYRWAGETDVFEALADVRRRFRIDDSRITLRGFSMGGAGAWHLGLHYPDRWSSVGAGAGFVDFYKYQKREQQLPPWQHATLGVYDAVDYALNAANVPIVTYGGENDPQLAASTTMADAAQRLGVELKVIVGPGMGHKFDSASREEFMNFHLENSAAGRPGYLARRAIRFTTRTLKYNHCDWLTLEELAHPWQPAIVEAEVNSDGDVDITTQNVTAFRLFRDVAGDAVVDGSRLPCRGAAGGLLPDVYYQRTADGWEVLDYERSRRFMDNPGLNKRHNLQGPIDDAFMQPFVCVVGTGEPLQSGGHAWAMQELERFRRTWDQWMRGTVRVVRDDEVTDAMIRDHNLVLFGDPGSNEILGRCLPELPLQWAADVIRVGHQEWDASDHTVNLIYPNPFNPRRYVVVNTGFSVRNADFRASNSWLFPKLGDLAIRRIDRTPDSVVLDQWPDVVWASNFNSHWRIPLGE